MPDEVKKKRGRPRKSYKWATGTPKPGYYFARKDEDSPEFRAIVFTSVIDGSTHARIFCKDMVFGLASPIAQTWTQWRPRPMKSQPAPVWNRFMSEACRAIGKKGGFKKKQAPLNQIAQQIFDSGNAADFLKACRRGRATRRQTLRYEILREVERLAGDTVERRRPDANTPDALALLPAEVFSLHA